ncbi:MAG TPA: NAD(+) kinase [Planctomycetaceae bacterium]|nr:NAD(+) kinase [Planctomycetaceae bacterium]
MPRRPKVAILGAPDRSRVLTALQRLKPVIAADADIVVEDLAFTSDLAHIEVDLVIVLGGDGSILQSARQLAGREIPVLGVNCGALGFLAALSVDDFLDAWPKVCAGGFSIVEHLMLRVSQIRQGKEIAYQLALNEAAILGGPPYTLMEIDLYADETLATTYRCDGLIVSTPVGSTAYNLSAGGPILRKHLRAIVIQPISPHTLTYRPLVDSADTKLEMVVARPSQSTSIVTDGRVLGQIRRGDRIRIRAADHCFQMLTVPGQNEYRTLREKLGWGGSVLR